MVRAKFKCESIEPYSYDGGKTTAWMNVTLRAVVAYGPNNQRFDENDSWSAATPAGQLMMHISNPNAFNQFVVGKDYYIDFTAVGETEQADDAGSNPPGPGQPGQP